MTVRAALVALGASTLVFAAACGTDRSYPTNRADDAYDLEAMSLASEDLPPGYVQQDARSFDNEQWAAVLDEADPEAKKNQLDAQHRVRNAITVFSWENPLEHLGKPYQFTAHSTLFSTAGDASASLKLLCDLPIDEKNGVTSFGVPNIGAESTGFAVSETLENFGTSVDTVICFRTGRVVHAIVQSGLEGTQDVGLSVKLANRMIARVDAAYDGKAAAAKTPEPEPTQGTG